MNKKIFSFLDIIAWCEGTSTDPNTRCYGYDVIVSGVSGKNYLTDFSHHPAIRIQVNRKGLYSTAAGRYQFIIKSWLYYAKKLGLVDFSPASQDRAAILALRECGSLTLIESGDIAGAISACNRIWASMPGSPYGQPTKSLDEVLQKYVEFGGSIS